MSSLKSVLFLAGTATAQITTSFWMIGNPSLGTDKIGYVASVIGVNDTTTTLLVEYDDETDTSALSLGGGPYTMTFAPSVWEQHTNSRIQETTSGSDRYDLRCEQPATSTDAASCTAIYGPGVARRIQCNTGVPYGRTVLQTVTHTFPARLSYSSGVETVVQTFAFNGTTRSTPAYCEDDEAYPSTDVTSTLTVAASNFGTYQVVITAGTEKLSATQGATPSTSSAAPTVPIVTATGSIVPSASPPASTGAAASVSAMGSMMVGVGSGVMAVVLQFL